MIKKFVSTLSFTALVALASASIGLAQGTTTPPASGTKPATGAAHQETAKTPAAQTPAAKAPAATTTATTTAAKPATPTWVIVEEDWWSPIQFNFSNALRNAEGKIRARDEKLAADEIDRAASWLRDAEVVADKSYQGDLTIAQSDLKDFAMMLRKGGQVNAKKLHNAFANASLALAKHHHFLSSKAIAEGDMKAASQHLMAAADHLREAARLANRQFGNDIVAIYDHYSPFGFWNETVVTEKPALQRNLNSIATEVEKLGTELRAK